MTTDTHRRALLLALALGAAACDRRPPSAPSPIPPPPGAPIEATVTAISPTTGSTVRPTRVLIRGTGFSAGATVFVNAMALDVAVLDSATIRATVPAHAAGPADVVVTNPSGLGATLTAAFTYAFEEAVTLTSSTDAVDAGGRLSVSWTVSAGRQGDWIALCPVGGRYDDDWYDLTAGEPSGMLTATAPTRPGQYEFQYLTGEGYHALGRSSPVTVR